MVEAFKSTLDEINGADLIIHVIDGSSEELAYQMDTVDEVLVCYSVSMVPNLYYVCKYAHLRFRMAEWVGKPALSAAVMGLAVWALRTVLPMNRILTLLEVVVGVAVYGFTAYMLGALSPEDLGAITRRLRRKGKNRQ